MENRDGENACTAHSDIPCGAMRYLSGVSFNSVVREQSAGYFYSFASFARDLWRACATAAYACMSLCLPARRSAGCLISHLHAYQCVL